MQEGIVMARNGRHTKSPESVLIEREDRRLARKRRDEEREQAERLAGSIPRDRGALRSKPVRIVQIGWKVVSAERLIQA